MLSDKIEYVDHVCRACGIIVTHIVKGLWMPSLSFFIDERDICLLLDRLNGDPEIAFIVPGGPPENRKAEARRGLTFVIENNEVKAEVEPVRQWKAVRTVDSLADGLHSLYLREAPAERLRRKLRRLTARRASRPVGQNPARLSRPEA